MNSFTFLPSLTWCLGVARRIISLRGYFVSHTHVLCTKVFRKPSTVNYPRISFIWTQMNWCVVTLYAFRNLSKTWNSINHVGNEKTIGMIIHSIKRMNKFIHLWNKFYGLNIVGAFNLIGTAFITIWFV